MENFKPATPPAWKRIVGNPLVQLSVLVIVAGGVGITLYQKGQQNLERRVSYLKSTVQINSTNNSALADIAESAPAEETPTADQASQTPEPPQDGADGVVTAYKVAAPNVAPTAGPSPTSAALDDKNKDTRSLAKTGSPHLVVYYAEVSRGSLNGLYAASRSTGQFMNFNDYSAGIVPSIRRSLSAAQTKILHKEDRPLDNSKTLQWSYGLKDRRDPSVEIGLTTFFELSEMDNNNLRGNLEIQRTWKEPSASGTLEIQRKSFPAIFEIGGDTGFFMAGVLPPQSNLENEDELTAIDVFKILRSPQFRSGDSELVIFVEFEKGN
nr:hypothetical protein [uncultured Bdellovibrio sp.]